MDKNIPRLLFPYVLTVVVVAVMIALRGSVLSPLLGDRGPFSGFMLGIIAVAWIGGLWPGILATVLSVSAGWAFFMAPAWCRGRNAAWSRLSFVSPGCW